MAAKSASQVAFRSPLILFSRGYLPEREIITGIGPVGVRCPRVRDRVGEGSQRSSAHTCSLPQGRHCFRLTAS